MNIFAKIAEKIIEEKENIIGPIAIEQANKVQGLKIDWPKREVSLIGNATQVLQNLVDQYKQLFGQASVEVCKEALGKFKGQIPEDQLPSLLRH